MHILISLNFSEYFLWADAILGTPLSETSLSSPVVDTFQKVCFSFWYDLSVCRTLSIIYAKLLPLQHGEGIQDLKVLTEEVGSARQNVVWQYSTTVEYWLLGKVQVQMMEKFKLIVTAVRGEKGSGYVAIDDFHFEEDADSCELVPPEASPSSTSPSTFVPTDPTPTSSFPDCNFDENTCGWETGNSENLAWERTRVSDLTDEGFDHPLEDHDGKKNHHNCLNLKIL